MNLTRERIFIGDQNSGQVQNGRIEIESTPGDGQIKESRSSPWAWDFPWTFVHGYANHGFLLEQLFILTGYSGML
jgi:hypothetical protein